MSDNVKTYTVRGKVQYFKFLGEPRPNYSKDGNEWTTDFYDFGKEGLAVFKEAGVVSRIKSKDDYLDGESFFTFKQKELTAADKPNRRVPVVDARGNLWDDDKLIGNGS